MARRANALKSTGPRTEQGKARVALNPLKHGRYADNLPEKARPRRIPSKRGGVARDSRPDRPDLSVHARCPRAAEAQGVQRDCVARGACGKWAARASPQLEFRALPGKHGFRPQFREKMDRLANCVWCAHRSWQRSGTKLKASLESRGYEAKLTLGRGLDSSSTPSAGAVGSGGS